jgi:hypothetical protein
MKKEISFGVLTLLLVGGLMGCASSPESGVPDISKFKEISLEEFGTYRTENIKNVIVKMNPGNQNEFRYSDGYISINRTGCSVTELEKDPTYAQLKARLENSESAIFYVRFTPAATDIFTTIFVGSSPAHYDIVQIDGLVSVDEANQIEAQKQSDREAADTAKRIAGEAAAEAKKKADAEAKEAKQNPKNLDRSLYKQVTVEDFSFDMVAGNLLVGSKVSFKANFLTKPTGTRYNFKDVNMLITLSSDHNFVRDIPEFCFTGMYYGAYIPSMTTVNVYVTVKKTGQTGECSVDIVEW